MVSNGENNKSCEEDLKLHEVTDTKRMYEAAPKELYSNEAKANMRVLFEIIVQ